MNCKICKSPYDRKSNTQVVCSYECSLAYAERLKNKRKNERRVNISREKKKALNEDIGHLKKVAQKTFNEFIRLRDRDLPCISCGTTKNIQYHAGHYKPQGGFGYLRFNEFNCHKQCSVCNNHKSGNLIPYRDNLILKIGIEEVEKLEVPNVIKKWSVEELREVIETYKGKVREIKKLKEFTIVRNINKNISFCVI